METMTYKDKAYVTKSLLAVGQQGIRVVVPKAAITVLPNTTPHTEPLVVLNGKDTYDLIAGVIDTNTPPQVQARLISKMLLKKAVFVAIPTPPPLAYPQYQAQYRGRY